MVTTRRSQRQNNNKATRRPSPVSTKEIDLGDDESFASVENDSEDDLLELESENEDDMELIANSRASRRGGNNKNKTKDSSTAAKNPPSKKQSKTSFETSDSDSDDSPKENNHRRPRKAPAPITKKKRPKPTKKSSSATQKIISKSDSEEEDEESNNSESDSSDDDIGKRLAATTCKRRTNNRNDYASSSSSDDDEDMDSLKSSDDEKENDNGGGGGQISDDDHDYEEETAEAVSTKTSGKRPRFAVRLAARNKKIKLRQGAKRAAKRATRGGGKGGIDDNNDSDDSAGSDVEIVPCQRYAKCKNKLDDSIDCSSDEDKDDGDQKKVATARRGGDNAFSQALRSLQAAQSYHADEMIEDVDDDEEEKKDTQEKEDEESDVEIIGSSPPPKAAAARNDTTSTAVGHNNKIRLKLRTTEINADGTKKGNPREESLSIGQHEPLDTLIQQYMNKNKLDDKTSMLVVMFDGEKLNMKQTPKDFEMDTDDIVDITVKPNPGRLITVTLRKGQGEKDSFKVRDQEPFRTLFEKYVAKKGIAKSKHAKVTFKFDGETLNLKSKPADFDMEDDDVIDVFV